ncbi:MAG: cytochrome c biogenesis protein CcsA [Bradymonadia bacterium]|jgi:heme exporter protein C
MRGTAVLLTLALLAMILGHYLVFEWAPIEAKMGVVQKIFYYHVNSAFMCYLGFLVCFAGSLAYLYNRKGRWDALALAGAEVGLVFGLIVLVTGPIWARAAWGVWWKWEPRLTSMALMALMFCAYWVLQTFGGAGEGVRRLAAGIAVFATPNIFFVRIAVQRWGGLHPELEDKSSGGLHPDMRITFSTVGLVLLLTFIVFLRMRYRMHFQERQVAAVRRRLQRIGVEA